MILTEDACMIELLSAQAHHWRRPATGIGHLLSFDIATSSSLLFRSGARKLLFSLRNLTAEIGQGLFDSGSVSVIPSSQRHDMHVPMALGNDGRSD